jgi:hypothetical protein
MQDRTGWFFGLDLFQVATTTCGLLVGSLLAAHNAYAAALAVVLFSLATAFCRIGEQPLQRVGGPFLAFGCRRALGKHRWFRETVPASDCACALPRDFGEIEVRTIASGPLARFAGEPDVAVPTDRNGQRSAVSLQVSGGGFALADPAEQDHFCSGWGDALAACASGVASAVALQVTTRILPDASMAGAIRREALVTVVAYGRHRTKDEDLLAEAARLGDRLVAAGLSVDGVLDAAGWATRVRETCDPCGQADRALSLGERAGVSSPAQAGPLAIAEDWSAVRVDGSWHRAYLVADWPRIGVPASWLLGLFLCEGPSWTLTLSFEPVPARQARQAIERQSAKISSDEEQRRRAGFRIGATHQRHQDDLAAREAELVAGHAEFEYVGVVVVSADTVSRLDEDGATLVAAAAGAGVELRPLHGRHLSGLGTSLPIPGPLYRKARR